MIWGRKRFKSWQPIRITIPEWVKLFEPLHLMYWNPVFQRQIIRNVQYTGIKNGKAFLVGICIPLIVTLTTPNNDRLEAVIILSFIVMAVSVLVVRLVGGAVNSVAASIYETVAAEKTDPILCTPLKDSEIFYGICIGNLMKGYRVFEVTLSFIFGLISFYILMVIVGTVISYTPIPSWIVPFEWPLRLLTYSLWLYLAGLGLLTLLIFSSAYFALVFDILVSIILTITYASMILLYSGAWNKFLIVLKGFGSITSVDNVVENSVNAAYVLGIIILSITIVALAGFRTFSIRRFSSVNNPLRLTTWKSEL